MTRFKDLSDEDISLFTRIYRDNNIDKATAQEMLSTMFDVSTRTIRNWANNLNLNIIKPTDTSRILIYDIETSQAVFKAWWTGKQYVGHHQMIKEPAIISIAWKFVGDDEVTLAHWDMDTHDDKELLRQFLVDYNSADMIVGQNNNRFDNRWINARAYKHDLDVNVHVKSFDIMKEHKRLMRIPSYSMAYITKFKGLELKQSHEGIRMWNMIEDGTPDEQREYMDKMLEYNRGDIISTEAMYHEILKYSKMPTHLGVLKGGDKYSCPVCGGTHIQMEKMITTGAGTKQYLMRCLEDEHVFKISESLYKKNN